MRAVMALHADDVTLTAESVWQAAWMPACHACRRLAVRAGVLYHELVPGGPEPPVPT